MTRPRCLVRTLLGSSLAITLLSGCPRDEPAVSPTSAAIEITLQVPSMHCDGCEDAIESSVTRLAGVVSCDALHDSGTVTVALADPGLEDDVVAAIEKLDYDVVRE